MLFLALPILASIGFTAVGVSSGSLAALWQSVFGVGPVFSLLQSAAAGGVCAGNIVSTGTSTMLGGLLYGIKDLIIPPPKKLEWWETDEFKATMGFFMLLAMLLLFVLGLKRCLCRGR